jgi:hypothetical protein
LPISGQTGWRRPSNPQTDYNEVIELPSNSPQSRFSEPLFPKPQKPAKKQIEPKPNL